MGRRKRAHSADDAIPGPSKLKCNSSISAPQQGPSTVEEREDIDSTSSSSSVQQEDALS